MKCPNCGSRLEDGNLFCENCGKEINIVPDYDPDTDLSVDIDGVFDKTQEMNTKEVKKKRKKASDETKEINTYEVKRQKKPSRSRSEYYENNKHVSREKVIDSVEDWEDDEANEVSAFKDLFLSIADFWNKNIITKIVVLFIFVLLVFAVLGCIYFVRKIADRQSVDYLVEQAEASYRDKDYESAIDYYERAMEKDPNNSKIKYAISNCYLLDGQDNNAIYILKEIAQDEPENATDTYERIFNIYYDNEDWAGINDLLLTCGDEATVTKFQQYLCRKPEFSVKEGEYDDTMYLELESALNGYVYYTIDGSDPDENSNLYTEPLYLESGEYDIKAVFVNEYGVVSEIAEGNYIINVKIPLAPQVSIESGSYNVPILISVISDLDCETYYVCYRATDKEEVRIDPDQDSTLYEYPLLMPMGPSEFRFISYNAEGVPSTIITRKYNVKIENALVSMADAANIATVYRYSLGGMTDTDGHVSTTNGKFEFIIEDALNQKGTIYYVINEYYVDAKNGNKRSLTGLRYAVNINDPNDYGTLEMNARGDYIIIKERSVNLEY